MSGRTAMFSPGTLGHNLFYGSDGGRSATSCDRRARGLGAVGLDDDVYRFGLKGTIDPARAPDLASALLAARKRLRRAARGDAAVSVESFDADRYNVNATLAENLLFGVATDETFAVDRLADHSYVRTVLDGRRAHRAAARHGLYHRLDHGRDVRRPSAPAIRSSSSSALSPRPTCPISRGSRPGSSAATFRDSNLTNRRGCCPCRSS